MADRNLVQSLLRGLDILTLISESSDGLSLQDLAGLTGLKPPTVHKLAGTLVSSGFVEKLSRPIRYRLGRAGLDLANAYWNGEFLRKAPAVLKSMRHKLPAATVTACQAVGGEVMTFLRIAPERAEFIERYTDRVMQPYATASALVFQAWWTDEERIAYRRSHPFLEHGAHLWGTPEKVDRFLAEARDKGYASPNFESGSSYVVAAPVFGAKGNLRACIGASIPVDGGAELHDEVADEVVRAAGELSDYCQNVSDIDSKLKGQS